MNLLKSIRTLRILALLLFIIPSIGLIGSLLFHNYLINFHFKKDLNYNFEKNEPGQFVLVLCDKTNNYCSDNVRTKFKKFSKLNQCYKTYVRRILSDENGKNLFNLPLEEWLYNPAYDIQKIEIKNFKKKIYSKLVISKDINYNCILNSERLFWYNLFPFYYESIFDLLQNEKATLGTSITVNPFFNGETSISNIVKRFPVKFVFKPIFFLTVIIMVFYWTYYNSIIKNLSNHKKNYYFSIFGILSALFLFFHVLFLGWTFENEFLSKLRRTFIVFFILFEILAQAFLIKKILSIREKFIKYLNSTIIFLKLIFVVMICGASILIISILIFYELTSKMDYILEWNYFLILLVFYFLSFLMWKKINF